MAEKMIQPPPWLRNPIMAMKGHDLTFHMEKTIGDRDWCSLSLPSKQLKAEFLTDLEKAVLKLDEIKVVLVEPSLDTCRLTLQRCPEANNTGHPSSQSAVYVMGSGDVSWNRVASHNELRKGNTIGVWSFRIGVVEPEQCFAISWLANTENEQDDDGAGNSLLNICPGYFSEPDWIDSYYNDDYSD